MQTYRESRSTITQLRFTPAHGVPLHTCESSIHTHTQKVKEKKPLPLLRGRSKHS